MSVRPDRRHLLRAAIGTATVLPAASMTRDTAKVLRDGAMSARDAGARFDGRTDDAAALQRSIDEAARAGRALLLPSGIARLGRPLNLQGRYVAIIGDPAGHTVLQASSSLACLIDAGEEREVIDSPLYLYGLTLDGADMTQIGIKVRYRHRTVFDTIAVSRCVTGIEEVDAWLARRVNCRVRATRTGWRLRGANHSSVWIGCTFTDARDVHLDIGVNGSAQDGNDALLFQGCDIEYGVGDGIRVARGVTATFDTCYVGEGIGGTVVRNAGLTAIRGGALFVGLRADRSAIVPLAGELRVSGTAIRGQEHGALERLIGADPVVPSAGRVVCENVVMQIKTGGDPTFPGDVLGTMPIRTFASLLGRNWRATANDVEMTDASTGDERSVRCRDVVGTNPLIGLAATLIDRDEARRDGTAYFAIVYQASRPVELRATSGAISRAPWRQIGTLPPTRAAGTYVKVDVPVDFTRFTTVELVMPATIDDVLTLHHATISDSRVVAPGPLSNLARAR